MRLPHLRRRPNFGKVQDMLIGQQKCPACRRPIIRGVDETRKYDGQLHHRECAEYMRRNR